jgi:hypothetical protein
MTGDSGFMVQREGLLSLICFPERQSPGKHIIMQNSRLSQSGYGVDGTGCRGGVLFLVLCPRISPATIRDCSTCRIQLDG